MGLALGLLGCGSFGSSFARHFKAHPDVTRFALCDREADRLAATAGQLGVAETYTDLDALCASDLEAVAIFSQPWLHVRQATALLRAGKHVYSAVPAAASLDECEQLVHAVRDSGRLYMMGETSIFRAEAAYCRQRAAAGDFGQIVCLDAEYLHDLDHGLREVARQRWGADFGPDKTGGAPFGYPTHSIGFAMAIIGALPEVAAAGGLRCLSVSGLGIRYPGDDWHRTDTLSGCPYANETALLELSNGSVARMSEMRRVGHPGAERVVRVIGTEATFESSVGGCWWTTKQGTEQVTPTLDFEPLPESLSQDRGGHGGSHVHLVHEFVSAIRDGRQPRMNVWEAVRTLAPGLVAHESAMQGGVRLPVPDWGNPPA